MSNELVPMTFEKMNTLADSFAKSGLFGVKTKDQALSLMALCEAENLHPAIACRDYDIIQGRPALKAKAKQARFQQSGGVIRWDKYDDTACIATFSHPNSPNPICIEWSIDRAKKAGLAGKDNWIKYPRQMLSSRVISEGVDKCYPAAGGLMYTPEEVMDFDPTPSQTVQNGPKLLKEAQATVESSKPLPDHLACSEAIKPAIESKVEPVVVPQPPEPPVLIAAEANRNMDMFTAMKDVTAFNEDACNAFLLEKKWIAIGQTWRDLIPSRMESIIAKSDNFVNRVKTWTTEKAAKNA